MIPILLCSVAVVAIAIERYLVLRPSKVAPPKLLGQVWHELKQNRLSREKLNDLKRNSPLGTVLAAGVAALGQGRDAMKDSTDEAVKQVEHELTQYLDALGTIASVAPLFGLLGTVVGMIKVFNAIVLHGSGNSAVLAAGISEALITTAAGLAVAIPALICHRFFERRIDTLMVTLEDQAARLIEQLDGASASRHETVRAV